MKKIHSTLIESLLVIGFSITVHGNTECSSYSFLNGSNRAESYYDSNTRLCDRVLSGWYRFGGEAGNQMADSCVKRRHCGAIMPGWLQGSHPSVADGVVHRRVCFQWSYYCCQRSTVISVRNCGRFYVYKLKPRPLCNERYCGNGLPSVSAPTTKSVTLRAKVVNKVSTQGVPTTKQTTTRQTFIVTSSLQSTLSTTLRTNVYPTDSTTTASVPGAIGQKGDHDTSFTIVIIVASLAAVLFVALIGLAIAVVLLLKKRRGHGKDARDSADISRSQLKDQHSSALSPANVARELRPVLSEAEVENKEHGNQRQEIELVESAGQKCAYAMLSVPGDSSYASLEKFKQKAQESVSESSVDALYVLQPKEEPTDELPIYVNQMTSDYMNI